MELSPSAVVALAGIIVAVVAAAGTAWTTLRVRSGGIEKSASEDLWITLREELKASRAEAGALRTEMVALRNETLSLREEAINLRSEIKQCRSAMVTLEERIKNG